MFQVLPHVAEGQENIRLTEWRRNKDAKPVATETRRSTLVLISISVQVDPNKEASKWVLSLRREARMAEY